MLETETSFFRDIHPFEALQTFVLPLLLKKRSANRTLNLWCAACSSGQEPYSIALLLRQHFPIFTGPTVHFLASDISPEMLSRARVGRYTQHEVSRGLPPALLRRYFQQLDSEWQIQEDIRRTIDFRQIDLAGEWPPLPPMDIIFMRNVLIYFDIETRKAILTKVREVLSPDGYLFLGAGETAVTLDDIFKPVRFDKTVCYKSRLD